MRAMDATSKSLRQADCYSRNSSEIAIVKPTMMTMRRTPFGPMRRATPAPQTPPTMAPTAITSACGHDTMPFQMKYPLRRR